MLKHQMLTAIRNLRRHWVSSVINLTGLALGLVCLVGTLNLVQYFKLDDRQYEGSDRTYVIAQQFFLVGSAALPMVYQNAPWSVAEALKADLPDAAIARVVDHRRTPITARDTPTYIQTSFADAEFLNLFPVPFVHGDRAKALVAPRSAILTKEAAVRILGSENVVGQTVLLYGTEPVTITGVISIPIEPTHLLEAIDTEQVTRFEMLVSMDMLLTVNARLSNIADATRELRNWRANDGAITYVRLPPQGSITVSMVDESLKKIVAAHASEGKPRKLFAQAVTEFRQSGLNNFVESASTGLSWDQLLLLIACVIILVSCLNYANLATAIAVQHRREHGIRRVLGASTAELIVQRLLEASLLIALALAIAFTMLAALNPLLRDARHIDLLFVWSHSGVFWLQVLVAVGTVIFVASIVPIIAGLRVHPAAALQSSRGGAQRQLGRRWLIGTQFFLAGVLLVFLSIVRMQQNELVTHAQASIDGPVVAIQNNLRGSGVDIGVLRAELLRQPHVVSVTSSSFAPWGRSYGLVSISNSLDASASDVSAINEAVDDQYFATLNIPILAGEPFRTVNAVPAKRSEFPIMIDRTMAKQLGWPSPHAAIGKLIYPGKALRTANTDIAFRIIGVVEDRVMQFSTNGATGNIYVSNANNGRTPLVRLAPNNSAEGLAEIRSVWKSLAPHFALRAQFIDDLVNDYASESAVYANALSLLTLLAVGIALAGLAGMAIHVVNDRLHEIGIRKTLGAKARQIVALLLNDLSRPIVAGSMIGWPIAYLISEKYLSIYFHRVALTPTPFVASLFGVLVVSFVAVALHTTRAARLKPIDVLRHE